MDDNGREQGQGPSLGDSISESQVNPPVSSTRPTWGEHIGSVNMSQPQNSVNAPTDGGTVVIVTVNRSDGDTPTTTAQHDNLLRHLPSHSGSNRDSENSPELSRTSRADHKIYADQLLTKERGYPLWVPGPGMQLPIEYRRRGISIGDVGIVTSTGEFDFLFNLFHPASHPVNRGLVPPGFSPLSLEELEHDIQKSIVYGPDTYLASSSVRKTSTWIGKVLFYASETAIGQRFESTATEAAILIMPDGAISQNLLNTWLLRQTIIRNARAWYRYARYTRGRNIKDGDIRIVVGFDKVASWGIATSTCNTGQTASFMLNHDSTHLYRWDCTGGSGRVGPHRLEIQDLVEDNDTVPLNQCVFVRTLNFTVSGEIWDDLPSEATQQLDQGSNGPDYRGSDASNRGSSGGTGNSGSGADSTSSGHQSGSMPGSLNCKQSVNFEPVELGINHPSAALHHCLHEKFPDASMIITEDMDWISVLKNDDKAFPEPEDLCERILKAHELQYHQVQLVRKDDPKLRSSSSMNLGEDEHMDVSEGASSTRFSVGGIHWQHNNALTSPRLTLDGSFVPRTPKILAPSTNDSYSSVTLNEALASPPHRLVGRPIGPSLHPSPASMHSERAEITVVGIPSVTIQDDRFVVGTSETSSTRSYTPIKVIGDGSFATVLLCDWHGTLPPNTPLPPMQCSTGTRPDWADMCLVAIKKMKKKWEWGWDECQKLKELQALRAIPCHPNIIPLYDSFLLPETKELYFVFEPMEGNLYQLIRARKGRRFAGGLVSHVFAQIVEGVHHIHSCGYFHRDIKPENVLVTTMGLFDYTSVSPIALPNGAKEKDVITIIKLADFGLARETKSSPPYTEYVSVRWYRAPEVLLFSRDYSNPVDMWALGTIMAELVNLKPLFPGSDQVDQVAKIVEVLGDPSDEYGTLGGGTWLKGEKLAKSIGFQFPKTPPKDFYSLFADTVPRSLVDCIQDLLRYDPDRRLTSQQCRNHVYLRETLPLNRIPLPLTPASQAFTRQRLLARPRLQH